MSQQWSDATYLSWKDNQGNTGYLPKNVYHTQSYYPELAITTLAIAARNENGFLKSPISPCGACRQVILEMEDRYQRPVRILLYGENGTYCFDSIKDLLPFCFVDSNMKE